jgi:hypothetical protein
MSTPNRRENHKRTCDMLGHVLTLGADADAWCGLATVLRVRLTPFEKSCLLAAVVGSLTFEDAIFVIKAIHAKTATVMPLPPFLDPVEDAAWWAATASEEELKAVLAAAFLNLPARDREEFLACISRRAAA